MGFGRANRQKAVACTGGTGMEVGKQAGKVRMLDQPQLGTVLSRIRMHTSLHEAKAVLPQHRAPVRHPCLPRYSKHVCLHMDALTC